MLREAAMDQWSFIVDDGFADQILNRSPSELGRFMDVSDDFATEQPQFVSVAVGAGGELRPYRNQSIYIPTQVPRIHNE